MALFKQRNIWEAMTRPATEEERRGERNSKYLGYLIVIAIIALIVLGLVKVGEMVFA